MRISEVSAFLCSLQRHSQQPEQNRPKCQWADGWVKKTWCVLYIMEYYLSIKEGHSAICKNMDKPRGLYLSEISQTQKDKYCMISYVESDSQPRQSREQNGGWQGLKGKGNGYTFVKGCRLAVIRGITCGDLMYSTVTVGNMYCILEIC